MQVRYIVGIGDFAKLAMLRHLMKDRRLAVCWYLTGRNCKATIHERHFNYLKRRDDFRHLAPEVFDQLEEIVGAIHAIADPIVALQISGILGDAFFHRNEVPKRASVRRRWVDGLVNSVGGANLVFLDPDSGIEGRRLTPKHVALAEIAALRQQDRALIIGHRQSGRRAEAKFLADRMRSLGCDPVEVFRFRLVASRFYVISDHDPAMSDLMAAFVKKWGNWVKSYRF
jgi:hypothetical protein